MIGKGQYEIVILQRSGYFYNQESYYMSNLSNANIIKGILIDFLLNYYQKGNILLGSELYFGSKKRQADILLINGDITGFEIKSKNDDFRRIREQLDDYQKVFDYQYLVITENHEKVASSLLRKYEGLIIITEDKQIKVKRRPEKIKNQDKGEILETIPLWFLKKHFPIPYNLRRASGIRNYIYRFNLEELKRCLRSFLTYKLAGRNKAFMKERGEYTHFEDIRLLESIYDQIV